VTSSTGRADTTRHPDVSEISDLTEGILPASRTAEVRRHLDDCGLCSDVQASLGEIRSLLGTLPGPPRMPAEIASRIDAALAAEALLDSTTRDEADPVSRETVPPPLAAEQPALSVRPAGHPRAATGPGRKGKARRRRTTVLSAVLGAAAVGVSVMFLQSVQTGSSDDAATTAQKESSVSATAHDGAEFSGSALDSRVHALLAAAPTQEAAPRIEKAPSQDSAPTGVSPKSSPDAAVPDCVQQGTGRADAPIAVEQGTYEGTAAFLVLMAHPRDSTRVQAYVIDADCVDRPADPTGEVLLTQSFPRY
jgi:hypothetical protein